MSKMKMAERAYKFFKRKDTASELFKKMDVAAKYVVSRDAHLNSLPRA